MYSDSYIDEETGNEIIDCCYHGTSGKKIDHSKCFITILCRCAGCGKEIEKDAPRLKFKMKWEGGTNVFQIRFYLHPECKMRMAKKLFQKLVLPLRQK